MENTAQPTKLSLQERVRTFFVKLGASTLLAGCCYGALLTFLFFIGIIFVSTYVVLASAFDLNFTFGVIMSVATLFMYFIYFVYLAPSVKSKAEKEQNAFTYISTYLRTYTDTQILLAILGFVQVAIWMVQPLNPYHEPRSVFVLSVSAFLAYLRSQIPKWQWLESLTLKDESEEIIPFVNDVTGEE